MVVSLRLPSQLWVLKKRVVDFDGELDREETFLLVDSEVPPIMSAMTIILSSP